MARTKDEILASAGSRYTYSANTMALRRGDRERRRALALVGHELPVVGAAGDEAAQGRQGRPARSSLNIGLLCSKTFDDAIFEELFEAKYGLKKSDMEKMNIKGVFQIWMKNGDYHEIALKECHAWTREGCKICPDFAAEHADISTGGIGKFNDWTLTIVRTDIGREIMDGMIGDGWIETRPGDDDPGAIALMHKLSAEVAQALAGVRDRRAAAAPGARRAYLTDGRAACPTTVTSAYPSSARRRRRSATTSSRSRPRAGSSSCCAAVGASSGPTPTPPGTRAGGDAARPSGRVTSRSPRRSCTG